MTIANARIYLRADGRGTVQLNDNDLTNAVRGLTIDAQVGHRPELLLDIVATPVEIEGEMTVRIPPAARAMLTYYGWTPPGRRPVGYLVRGHEHPYAPEDVTVMYEGDAP